jgi:hypothetical protein
MGKCLLKRKVEECPGEGRLPTRVDAQAGSVEVSMLVSVVNVGDHAVVSLSGKFEPLVSGSNGINHVVAGGIPVFASGDSYLLGMGPDLAGLASSTGPGFPSAMGSLGGGLFSAGDGGHLTVLGVSAVDGESDKASSSGNPELLRLFGSIVCFESSPSFLHHDMHGSLNRVEVLEFSELDFAGVGPCSSGVSGSVSPGNATSLVSEVLSDIVVSLFSLFVGLSGVSVVSSHVVGPSLLAADAGVEGMGGVRVAVGGVLLGGDDDGKGEGGEGESHVEVEEVVVVKLIIKNEN